MDEEPDPVSHTHLDVYKRQAAILPGGSAVSFFLAFSIPAGLGTAFLYPSIQSLSLIHI